MQIDFSTTKIIAHRGASFYAPENTMAAFVKAVQLGAKWVEFDVSMTLDGEVIVFHDERLERTTNGHGMISNLTYPFLQTLDVGKWFHSQYSGERILTLSSLITFLQSVSVGANIELKMHPGKHLQLATAVLKILSPYLKKSNNLFLFSSFYLEPLATLRALNSEINIGILLDHWVPNWETVAAPLNYFSVHVNHEILTQAEVELIKNKDKKIFAYTVNNQTEARRLFAMGVDAIFSDKPDLLVLRQKSFFPC